MSIRAKRVAAILGTASVVTAGAFGVAQQAVGQSAAAAAKSATTQSRDSQRRGPDLSALAAKPGVSTTALKAALDATRPTRRQDQDRGARLAAFLATELGVSADKAQAALTAAMPARPDGGKPPRGARPPAGSRPADGKPRGVRPDEGVLAGKLAAALGVEEAKVTAALAKARTAGEADHAAREKAMAAALAEKLGLNAETVQSSLQALRPAMPKG
jgi:HD-GYP domain-containing protein (c-di-GMP phosphodiesterase class II)